jgi:hypothetical protein
MLAEVSLARDVSHVGGHLLTHWQDVFAGATMLGILAHAVNTAPTPQNAWGQWILGIVKYIVGQRVSAANAFAGFQTEATAVTNAQKAALACGSTMEVVKSDGVLKPLETVIKGDK